MTAHPDKDIPANGCAADRQAVAGMSRKTGTLTLPDIAVLLGRNYAWVSRRANRKKLYEKGFPRPMDLPGRPTWDAAQIQAWKMAAQGQTLTPPPQTTNVENLDKHRNRLAERLSA